jgi:Tfp pilus assembly PilM family ATPase
MRSLIGAYKVGVDIASTAVRVVEVSKVDADGFVHIRGSASVPLEPEAVSAGKIRQQVIVGQALAAAFSEAGVKKTGFVLGATTSISAVSQQQITMAVRPFEREAMLRNSNVPVSAMIKNADATMAMSTVRTIAATASHEAMALMNVAAIPTEELEHLDRVCRLAGVTPRVIDLPSAALFRAMVRINRSDPPTLVSTIVDIGATKILVATREGEHLRSVRLIPGGGLDITRKLLTLMESADKDDPRESKARFAAAETQKIRLRVTLNSELGELGLGPDLSRPSEYLTAAEQTMNEGCSDIVEKIARAVASDAEGANRKFTQGVQLIGAAARTRGLVEALQERLNVPVRLTSPWVHESSNVPEGTRSEDFATAIGLALWRPES